ncbi:MAG TPA: pyrroline-5-carboxylate reductase [Chthoniobacterales bacterium]
MSKLGFIGCGKMTEAILQGVVKSGVFPGQDIVLSSRSATRVAELATATGSRSAGSNAEAARTADVIVLGVKPGDIPSVLSEIAAELPGKLLVSIAAGVPISRLTTLAGEKVAIVRVMPNTPALVHHGASAYAVGPGVTAAQKDAVEKIFGAVGTVYAVKEEALDAVTGVSGSGPAYIYMVIEALADGGVLTGLPRDLSLQLATQTVIGAGEMVAQTGLHPATLRDNVASPGGTTIAAIEKLEQAGLRAALIGAVRASAEKSIAMRSAAGK